MGSQCDPSPMDVYEAEQNEAGTMNAFHDGLNTLVKVPARPGSPPNSRPMKSPEPQSLPTPPLRWTNALAKNGEEINKSVDRCLTP